MRRINGFAALVAFAFVAAQALPIGRYNFPHYMQCDPRWGNNEMGVTGPGERATICEEGCAMTSTTMAMAGLGVRAPTNASALIDPADFNSWLIATGGYLCMAGDCNNLNLTAPERLTTRLSLIGEKQKPSYGDIAAAIRAGTIIHVAHVRNNSHFVLLVWPGSAPDTFAVHDPYYSNTEYDYGNITDIIAFHVDQYPLYKQCDPQWGSANMGSDNMTICQVGCLMSSVSMALAGNNIAVTGAVANPLTVDVFLQTHDGFVDGSCLVESKIPSIAPNHISWPADGMHTSNDLSWANVTTYLDRYQPRVLIANVMQGQHFVLVVGYRADGDTLVVNDPGFDRNTYSYSKDVVGWRIFDMKPMA